MALTAFAAVPGAATAVPTWSASSLTNPTGVTALQLLGVSCFSSSACTAGGGDQDSAGWGAVAEAWNGTGWTFQSGVTRSPGPNTVFNGVSCTAATTCVAVGSYGRSGVPVMMAQVQNGSTWTYYNIGTASGASQGALNGVSCVAWNWCMAVGYKMVSGDDKPIMMFFNGSAWSEKTMSPMPGNATLNGVSCVDQTYCLAVGSSAGVPLAEKWENSAWSVTSTPPVCCGLTGAHLHGVSCLSKTWCAAVGGYTPALGFPGSLAERWDGSTWVSPAPDIGNSIAGDDDVYGVSCRQDTATPPAILCWAVGENYASSTNTYLPTSFFWNGVDTSWTAKDVPLAPSAQSGRLRGISCYAWNGCKAAGWSLFSGTPGGLIETLVP